MTQSVVALLVAMLLAAAGTVSPAAAQDRVVEPPPDQPATTSAGAAAEPAPAQSVEPMPVAPTPMLPRQARWKAMEVSYMAANIRHPALYCRSFQERVDFNDRYADNIFGWAAAMAYEYIQFPAQLLLTPVAVVLKPPWTTEVARP